MMIQWAMPTLVHCSIRVWRRVSFTVVTRRRPGESVRTAGWPSRITLTWCTIVRTKSGTATRVMANETTMAKICME